MATHDYVIANQSGAAFRTDLNNALAAIVSNNSSSTEPSTKYAYQWWADTNTGILKIRNSANDGWVELLQLDGTLTLEDGSAANPGLAFRDDLDTGIFSGGANQFQITTGGAQRLKLDSTEVVFNDNGVDTDFRIEGDNETNLFKVDASTDKVGIGVAAPSNRLHIRQELNATSVGTAILQIENIRPNTGTGAAALAFRTNEITSGASYLRAQIAAEYDGSSNVSGRLDFFTVNSSGAFAHAMRIDDSQNVGIGVTTVSNKLHLDSGGSTTTIQIDSDTESSIDFNDHGGSANRYKIGTNINGNNGQFEIRDVTNSRSSFVVLPSGFVGVSNTNPETQLHISGSELRLENGSVPFIRLKATNAQSSNHFDYGRILADVAGNVRGILDWKRQSAADDAYFTIFNTMSSSVIQERLRITSKGTLCVHAAQQTNVNNMNVDALSMPKFFENTTGQDTGLVAADLHFQTVIRGTSAAADVLFTFEGGGNCGVFVEVTAYYSSAVSNFQGRQRFFFRAGRTASADFSTEVGGPYEGQGTATAAYFSPSFTSSGSGASQVLGCKVTTQNMGAYVRILYVARVLAHDSINSMTVNR